MIVTTTNDVGGKPPQRYLAVVSGEAVMGTNLVKDILANVTDLIGGRSGSYEKELRNAKATALEEMRLEAEALGADAIVGVDLDYEHIGGSSMSLLMVVATGTAVTLGADAGR